MQGATEALAGFVANTKFGDLPADVVDNAKLMMLDTFGVILAAARDPGCKLLAQWAKDQESAPRATVIGQGFRTSPLLAALVNGHASHAHRARCARMAASRSRACRQDGMISKTYRVALGEGTTLASLVRSRHVAVRATAQHS